MRQYIAIIHKDPESDYGVSFPDFPGCVTAGSDLDEAWWMARQALAAHSAWLVEEGEVLPEPSSLQSVMSDVENRDGVAAFIALDSAGAAPGNAVPDAAVDVGLSLPASVVEAMDRYAGAHGITRAQLVAEATRRLIREVA